jgi:MATE family multidrug resistance protein
MKYPAKITKTYLFKLSVPIFFANLATPLVGIVDTSLLGHLNNVKYLAAASIATSVISMIFWSFGFLRMGTTGLVSQSLGKGDYREIVISTIRNLSIAALIGVLILFVKYPVFSLIDSFFTISDETSNLIKKYISVRLFSAPAELAMYVLVGLFIGIQKTKISSFFVTFFSISNIILSIYFVNHLNLDIFGVALGTVLSSYLTIFIFMIFTYFYIKKTFNIIPRYRKVFIAKKALMLFNMNFDLFIRTMLLTFSFLWFTYLSSELSEDYLAVNLVLLQFIVLASFFLDSYAFSTEGVVGFSLGRKVKKSFLLVVENSFKLSFFTGLIISVLYLIFYKQLIGILTDLDYLKFLSYTFVVWVIIIPPIASLCYQYDGIFIGTSQTAEMRNAMIISVASFIFASIFLKNILGNHGLWLSLIVFMGLRSLMLILNKF